MILRVALAVAAVVSWPPLEAQAPPQAIPPLATATLEDQFGSAIATSAWRGRVVVIVAGDRDGAAHFERWRQAIRDAVPQGIQLAVVADLVGAPRLVRGVIRNSFPRDTAARVLLDWDGRVGRAVRGERESLVVVVYGPDGRALMREALPRDPAGAPVLARIARAAVR